jgi:pimeloyl-ACP methyl ester carboxylesterase
MQKSFGMLPDGPKNWIFLRGLARESGHWGSFLDTFHETFPETVVEAIDLPGVGEMLSQDCPISIEGMTELVRHEAKLRFPVDRFGILAISLGGMVAMEWMQLYPSDIEAAVLINSSSKDSAFFKRLRFQIWPELIRVLGTTNLRDREKKLINLLMNSDEAKRIALPLWAKIATERPVTPLNFSRQLFAAARFAGLKSKPNIPVLLLNSLGDRLVDPSCSESLQQKFQWKLERHAWAGHDLPWDAGFWVCERISRFFSLI